MLVSLAPRWAWWTFVGIVLVAKTAVMTGIDAEWVRHTLESATNPLPPRNPDAPTGPGTFTHFDDVKRFLAREHIAPTTTPAALDRYALGWLGMAQQWLPAAAIAMLGALGVDRLLREDLPRAKRARQLAGAGAGATALAYFLQAGYASGGGGWLGPLTIPFSKWFFSPAYCLLSAGTGAMLLALFFWTIHARGRRRLAEPWRTYGVNALALYVGAELSWKLAFSRWKLPLPSGESSGLPGAINAWIASLLPDGAIARIGDSAIFWSALSGLTFALLWLTGWWLICHVLDRRRTYIRV